jgi:hypothetical protein
LSPKPRRRIPACCFGAVQQQPARRVIAVAYGRIAAKDLERQSVQRFGKLGVVNIEIDAAKAVHQEDTPATVTLRGTKGGVQILGRGSHALSFGVHPDGFELKWRNPPGTISRAELTAIDELQVCEFVMRAAPLIGAAAPDPSESVEHVSGSSGRSMR